MAILSIQSRVTSGYVGNAAATPVLQRLGRTVWPIDTVAFSNHPAHGSYRGGVRPASEIEALIDGLHQQDLLAQCDAVLSGYLGSADTGRAVLAAVERVRRFNPSAPWCCDPVMGDHGKFYVAAAIPPFFKEQAVPAADIILPNAFEAEYLSGIPVASAQDAARASEILLAQGPKTVVISGIPDGDRLGAVAASGAGCWACMTPVIDAPAFGAGDAFTALFVSYYLAENDLPGALGQAVSGIHKILSATAEAGTADLNLVAALPALDHLAPLAVERIG